MKCQSPNNTCTNEAMWMVGFAVLRLALPTHGFRQEDIFKDLAHVFTGGLFGAALATKQRGLWAMAVGISLVEVVAAVWKG